MPVRAAVNQASARIRSHVIRQARYAHQNGKSEFTLRLNPPELGRIRLELQMAGEKLEVRIRVENAQVREALQGELQNLDSSLRTAQVDLQRLEVADYQAGTHDGGSGGLTEDREPAQGEGAAPPGGGDDDHPQPDSNLITQSGRINYLV